MDKVKFRAWDATHNKMIDWEGMQLWMMSSLENDNIMRFTGFKDKNADDADVYENDLLGFWFGKYYNKQLVEGKGLDPKSVVKVEMIDGCWVAGDQLLSEVLEYKHICGNIHQNPELTKEN